MRKKVFVICAAGFVLLGLVAIASAAESASQPASTDWPQWRGSNRDGIASNSPKLLDAWPKEGPKLLWKSGPIPGGSDGGSSSPVVADGRVFVYCDHPKGYVVTSKMLSDWGWMDGVPDELATKIETARVEWDRLQRRPKTEMEKYVADFLATLDPAEVKKFGEHIRKRIERGCNGPGWWGMASIVNEGVQDKVYSTFTEWADSSFGKGNSFKGHIMRGSHGDGGVGANAIMEAVVRQERIDMVFCLDASTGKHIWKVEFPGESRSLAQYPFYWITSASSTPAISNGNCYVVGGGGFYCLSVKDGSVVWKTKAGFTHSSPLVANGMVYDIFETDNHRQGNPIGELKAFDAATGKLIWSQGCQGRLDAWGSVVSWNHDGKNYLIVFGPDLICIDAANGELVWEEKSVQGKMGDYEGHWTPVVIGDLVVISTGAAYKITPQKAEVLWKAKFGDYCCSPIVYQDHIYIGGYYQPRRCVDLKTGHLVWEKSRAGEGHTLTASPAMADDKVFLFSGEGYMDIVMVKATGDKFEELGRFRPLSLKACNTSPAIACGRLYVRSVDCVACYDLAAPAK